MEDFIQLLESEVFYVRSDLKTDVFYLQLEMVLELKGLMKAVKKFDAIKKRLKRICKLSQYLRGWWIHENIKDRAETLKCELSELKADIRQRKDYLFDLMTESPSQPILFVNCVDDYVIVWAMIKLRGFDGLVYVNPHFNDLVVCAREKDMFNLPEMDELVQTINNEKFSLPLAEKTETYYLLLEMLVEFRGIRIILEQFDASDKKLNAIEKRLQNGYLKFRYVLNQNSCHLKSSKYLKRWWIDDRLYVKARALQRECGELLARLIGPNFDYLSGLIKNALKLPLMLVNGIDAYFIVWAMKEFCGFEGFVLVHPNLRDLIATAEQDQFKLIC